MFGSSIKMGGVHPLKKFFTTLLVSWFLSFSISSLNAACSPKDVDMVGKYKIKNAIMTANSTPSEVATKAYVDDKLKVSSDTFHSLKVEAGTATSLYTEYVTLDQGFYMAYYYHCLSGKSEDYYLHANVISSSGTVASSGFNRGWSQVAYYHNYFPFKVTSSQAQVRFMVKDGNGDGTITNDSSSCTSFNYTKIF
jgi:hypothetical protein